MSVSRDELRDITREFFKKALLNSDPEVISENNNRRLLKEVSMTAEEMQSDINRWADEINELAQAVESGNVETPDMGGLDPSEHEEVAKWLSEASYALGLAMNIVAGGRQY